MGNFDRVVVVWLGGSINGVSTSVGGGRSGIGSNGGGGLSGCGIG